MKRLLLYPLLLIFLCGCAGQASDINHILNLRSELLNSNGCNFEAIITADYGEQVHTFQMMCQGDKNGDLDFKVVDPETIAGITGNITDTGGSLTFDDKALVFNLLADGQISPVSAPWILLKGLRNGYISASGKDELYIRTEIDDSFSGEALHIDVWLEQSGKPARCEIVWKGRRIIAIDIRNFTLL